ncbi:metalloproteinase inhibitor 3 [Euwallacea fornicatus]|uniref:metalloproteinase inhibitor 3 n=1 Tax=Euwallacea fornicatus TaxID=995702 RepID=UPI00338E1E54
MRPNVWTLSLAVLVSSISYCHGCSCMQAHPQEHYCNSDFVILARIKKEQIMESTASKVYKVRIRKEFKISEKGLAALKSGKLHSAMSSAVCGVDLKVGKLYVISGTINSLRAQVNICNMIKEWNELSKRQRKGLRMLYKRGCECKIKNCTFGWCSKSRPKDSCIWKSECETRDGICLRQAHGSCMWNKNKQLTSCRSGVGERPHS